MTLHQRLLPLLRFRSLPAIVLATAGLLPSAGCLKRGTDVERGNREQILHRATGYEIGNLDPHLATNISELDLASALFEGLVTEDPSDLHPVPGVAESWELSADRLTYTFHLRAGVQWSNGTPLTAQDFVASWQRILTPALASPNAGLLYVLQGAEAFAKGGGSFSQVGVQALDARTLRVTLAQPTPYFLALLTHPAWLPVPVAVIAANGGLHDRANPWTRPGKLVGNGAFTLQTWEPNQRIVVVKSPRYWDAAHVRLQAIHFHPIDSIDAEERAFRAGQLHVTYALPFGKIDAYRRDGARFLRADAYLNTYFLRFNVARPFLNDPRVRRALALAIDRAAIADKILRGGQLPAYAFTPPGIGGYTPTARLPTDFNEARRLLAEAGYPGGRGLPPFELLFISENHRLIAEAVQEMWRKELGVQLRLGSEEFKTLLEQRRTGQYQILFSDWVGDYPDPSTFLDVWRSDSGNNHTGWANADYDSLLRSASLTTDSAARNALFQKAEALLLAAAPIAPLYYNTHIFLLQPSVHGWHPTLLDHHPYKDVWLEE
ncbi:MAG TPA: peptide ABC transporter substrate-binding protein [Opitutaceae bacterium]|nr:peptide ABC transporter substrate-binding protein [Opitutaceae bacterium]